MGLKITLIDESSAWVIAKERLWLTADQDRLVAEGDDAAAFLFAGVGTRFPRADAERYGLLDNAELVEDTVTEAPAEPAAPEPEAETKPKRRPRRPQG